MEYLYILEGQHEDRQTRQSPYVRIPARVVEALKLKEGDDIEIRAADWRQLDVARRPTPVDLLKRLRSFRGRLPTGFKVDRDEANGR